MTDVIEDRKAALEAELEQISARTMAVAQQITILQKVQSFVADLKERGFPVTYACGHRAWGQTLSIDIGLQDERVSDGFRLDQIRFPLEDVTAKDGAQVADVKLAVRKLLSAPNIAEILPEGVSVPPVLDDLPEPEPEPEPDAEPEPETAVALSPERELLAAAAPLTDADIRCIKSMSAAGANSAEIARELGRIPQGFHHAIKRVLAGLDDAPVVAPPVAAPQAPAEVAPPPVRNTLDIIRDSLPVRARPSLERALAFTDNGAHAKVAIELIEGLARGVKCADLEAILNFDRNEGRDLFRALIPAPGAEAQADMLLALRALVGREAA